MSAHGVAGRGGAERGLVPHLAAFAGALREAGVPVGLSDEVDAAGALPLVDVLDRDEVAAALRCALKIRREHWPVFDELFVRLWRETRPLAHVERHTRAPPNRAVPRGAKAADGAAAGSEGAGREAPAGEPGWSADEVLRRKPFEAMSE
ncbi:MAG TPA: hypothetical protein VFN40_00770, partial [Gemmatimonadales bacterium]|nr:hypothetical protein [Gemmatimonadales bacterium]